MIKFLHTSDLHLGMRRHFLNEESEPRYRQARLDAIATLGEVAREEECAFVLVAGDFLDSNQADPQTVARAAEALGEIPVPIYILPGNHDAADASSMLCSAAFERIRPAHVMVLSDSAPVEVAPGVELVPAPLHTRRPHVDLVQEAIEALVPGPLRIVLGHGAVDQLSPEATDPALIRIAAAEAALADGRIHYVALGDRHSATSVGRTGRIRYSGSPEPTAFDEERAGYALVVSLDRDSIEVVEHQIGRWRFERVEHHFSGDEDVAALRAILHSLPGKERRVLRLTLTGTLTLQGHAQLEELLEEARQLFASVGISERRSELSVLPQDSDFSDLKLVGFAQEALDELRATASAPGADASTARDALALLVRLTARSA